MGKIDVTDEEEQATQEEVSAVPEGASTADSEPEPIQETQTSAVYPTEEERARMADAERQALQRATSDARKNVIVGTWAGMPNYQCPYCPFDSVNSEDEVVFHILDRAGNPADPYGHKA